jgi:hypothetical protein
MWPVSGLVVPSVSRSAVFKHLLQQDGEDAALRVDLTTTPALSAAMISIDLSLPRADSVTLAAART